MNEKTNWIKNRIREKTLTNTNFGNACEYVTVKECQCPLTLSFMGNTSGSEPLYKNGKPYEVSVVQKKEDARVGGPVPMTKKAKCISFDFVNHRLHLTCFIQSIGGSFWAPFLGKKRLSYINAPLPH